MQGEAAGPSERGRRGPGRPALVFDFDGTLVDTMPIHYLAYQRTFAEVGLELTREEFYGSIGGKASETIPRFLRGRPCARSVAELHARKQELAAALLRSEDIPVLATAEILFAFAGVVPIALASSGSRSGIDIVLDRLGWRGHFDAIVTGGEVVRGKPAPDLFLLAAERLGVAPARCLAFEDTDDGVAAARAAQMAVFDVRRAHAPVALAAPPADAPADATRRRA
ncbi:MAG TPA: HAD-IA family hydrolase [Kofleriaceae bacterium]|nr:HAD-IA family hydrolase [Kofleriaceae bacterium]